MAIINRIWAIDPGIPIFLSPLNFYPNELCSVTNGNQIPNEGAIIADYLAGVLADVFRGPDLFLTVAQLRADQCHQNSAGIVANGLQLKEFFDG